MKSISPSLQNHFGADCMTLAVLWKLITVQVGSNLPGITLGFTTHDQDILYEGITYLADTGMTRTATAKKSDLSVDNLEVTAFLDSDAISEANIRAGVYDFATLEIRVVNWADLSQGDMKITSGTVGQIVMKNGVFTAELRGMTQYLTTVVGSLYGPICRAEWGSGLNGIDVNSPWLCTVDVTLYRQSGRVTTSEDANTIVPVAGLLMIGSETPTIAAPGGWFEDGILTFTTGAMSGVSVELKSWDGVTLTTFLPMPFQPQPGDTFTIEPGCDKLRSTCFNKFNNIINFRGEPDIPGMDLILQYPNAHQ